MTIHAVTKSTIVLKLSGVIVFKAWSQNIFMIVFFSLVSIIILKIHLILYSLIYHNHLLV